MFELEDDDEAMEVQMAPLIDCVFLLLIFFLVTSTLKKVQFELPLEFPAAAQTVQAAPAQEILVISVDAAGQLFVNGTIVTNSQFLARLKEATAAEPGLHVRVDGDVAAPYGQVARIIDEVRALGITKIGFKTLGPKDAAALQPSK